MNNINWIDFIMQIFDKVISLVNVLYTFLTYEVNIDLPEWLNDILGTTDIHFSVWLALGGVGITTLILWRIFR